MLWDEMETNFSLICMWKLNDDYKITWRGDEYSIGERHVLSRALVFIAQVSMHAMKLKIKFYEIVFMSAGNNVILNAHRTSIMTRHGHMSAQRKKMSEREIRNRENEIKSNLLNRNFVFSFYKTNDKVGTENPFDINRFVAYGRTGKHH